MTIRRSMLKETLAVAVAAGLAGPPARAADAAAGADSKAPVTAPSKKAPAKKRGPKGSDAREKEGLAPRADERDQKRVRRGVLESGEENSERSQQSQTVNR